MTWKEEKNNLLKLVTDYPNRVGDALDSAYLAGLDDAKVSLVEKVKQKMEWYDKDGHEQKVRGNIMLAYDMDSRYIALKHLLEELL